MAIALDDAGSGLIESMLAVAVLGLSLAALLQAFGALGLAAGHLDRATAADAVAHSVAESILDQPYSAAGSYSTSLNVANPRGYAVSVTVESSTDPAAVTALIPPSFVPVPASDYGLQRITVRVTPTQGGSTRTTRVLKRR